MVEYLGASRFEAHDGAARAWARSLVALGQVDQARAVLIRDFRHGGVIASLVALADLEAGSGRVGVAAVNYARVAALDPVALAGRREVCALFRQRARRMLALAEPIAADRDMRRVVALCGVADREVEIDADARMWQRIRVAAQRRVRAQRTLSICRSCDDRLFGHRAEDEAYVAGLSPAAALRFTSRRARSTLTPGQTVGLLVAERNGDLGVTFLADHELRARTGMADWDDLAGEVARLSAHDGAYVRLRLVRVMEVPGLDGEARWQRMLARTLAPRGGGGEKGGSGAAPSHAWRVPASQGDLRTAELLLGGALRGLRVAVRGSATDPASQQRVVLSRHWLLELPIDGRTTPLLLAMARMRAARGGDVLALRISRRVIEHAAENPALALTLARRELAWGRPWGALAVAEAGPAGISELVRGAVGTALALMRSVCRRRPCGASRDADVVRSVLGEAWIPAQRELLDLALRRHPLRGTVTADGCPTVEEVLARDAAGPLAALLRRAMADRSLGGLAEALERVLESDPALLCAGRFVVPILAAGGYDVSAAKLAARLGLAPELEAAGQLELHAQLASIAGQKARARRMLTEAAAVSDDPRATWSRAAFFARRTGARELESEGWRQVLLHGAGGGEAEVELFLLVRQLLDLNTVFAARHLAVGREALARGVASFVRGGGEEERWGREDALLGALAQRRWAVDGEGARLQDVLRASGLEPAHHARAWHQLTEATGAPGGTERDAMPGSRAGAESRFFAGAKGPHPAFLAADAIARERLRAVAGTRIGLLRGRVGVDTGVDMDVRTDVDVGVHADEGFVAVAAGLAVTGDIEARAQALAWLLRFAHPRDRAGLLEVVASGGVALSAAPVGRVKLLPDADLLFRLALGLDLDPLELRARTRAWGSSLSPYALAAGVGR
ncbi:MAG: hypothetical protein V3V08_17990 [Nannocystaceae bacterium]